MTKAKDLYGKRFGRLLVIARSINVKNRTTWLCQCDCGNKITVSIAILNIGHRNSCGCLKAESARKNLRNAHKRQVKHGMFDSPEYAALEGMIQRCNNPNEANYHNYGGRGISVCDEWRKSFESFYSHIGARPNTKADDGRSYYSLDRIDNDGNYEPGNVRWATQVQQYINRRNIRR